MDKLNDAIQKKNLGAFYTPTLYAEKSLELVREAIKRVPAGNDYIILDRCAGTGNLELGLTDEEKSHAILSTVEYYEYKVLLEILGDKVRYIIPPTEKEDTFNMGLVRGADALSEEYVNNPVIKQYIDDPKCTIILFENPPYAETTSLEHQRLKQSKDSSGWKNSFVVTQMKKEVKAFISNKYGDNVQQNFWIDGLSQRQENKIKTNIASGKDLFDILEDTDFGCLIQQVKNLPDGDKKQLFGDAYSDNNLSAVKELRNAVSHHKFLAGYKLKT